MKKYRFTTVQRFAIWRAYGKKCFYCEQPLTFTEVTIDHVIPEHILDDAEQLQVIKIQYGLDTDFSINEPIVITFSLNTDEVLRKGSPATALPTDYPSLCNWLEKDLIKQLSSLLTCSFYYPEASQRTGETLSVRLAFLQLNFNELDKFTSPWWEILEIQYYSEVYGSSYSEAAHRATRVI